MVPLCEILSRRARSTSKGAGPDRMIDLVDMPRRTSAARVGSRNLQIPGFVFIWGGRAGCRRASQRAKTKGRSRRSYGGECTRRSPKGARRGRQVECGLLWLPCRATNFAALQRLPPPYQAPLAADAAGAVRRTLTWERITKLANDCPRPKNPYPWQGVRYAVHHPSRMT